MNFHIGFSTMNPKDQKPKLEFKVIFNQIPNWFSFSLNSEEMWCNVAADFEKPQKGKSNVSLRFKVLEILVMVSLSSYSYSYIMREALSWILCAIALLMASVSNQEYKATLPKRAFMIDLVAKWWIRSNRRTKVCRSVFLILAELKICAYWQMFRNLKKDLPGLLAKFFFSHVWI